MNKLVLLSLLIILLSFPLGLCLAKQLKTEVNTYKSVPTKSVPSIIPTIEFETDENELWNLVQKWRKDSGYAKTLKNQYLCTWAKKRSIEIQTDFNHNKMVEYNKSLKSGIGENLSKDIPNAINVLSAWLRSPTHRENLERNYKYSCIQCTGTYCVQSFSDLLNGEF